MTIINKFDYQTIQTISQIIAEMMSGSEITKMLNQLQLDDASLESTKWKRLDHTLANSQNIFNCGNKVVEIIRYVFLPTARWRYHNNYQTCLIEINKCVSYYGLELRDDGEIYQIKSTKTKSEINKKYDLLRTKLLERNIHSDIFKFCTEDIVTKDYYSIIFESSKAVFNKIREMTEIAQDGNRLIQTCFDQKYPIIVFNKLETQSEIDEYNGFRQLLFSIGNICRNPRAHTPKIFSKDSLEDCLDLLTIMSFVLKKLDHCTINYPLLNQCQLNSQ